MWKDSEEAEEGGAESRVQADQWENPQDFPEETGDQSRPRRPKVRMGMISQLQRFFLINK